MWVLMAAVGMAGCVGSFRPHQEKLDRWEVTGDPDTILKETESFLEGYPYSLDDFPCDLALLEEVLDIRRGAWRRLHGVGADCRELQKTRTFNEVATFLEKEKGDLQPHTECCVPHMARAIRDALKEGGKEVRESEWFSRAWEEDDHPYYCWIAVGDLVSILKKRCPNSWHVDLCFLAEHQFIKKWGIPKNVSAAISDLPDRRMYRCLSTWEKADILDWHWIEEYADEGLLHPMLDEPLRKALAAFLKAWKRHEDFDYRDQEDERTLFFEPAERVWAVTGKTPFGKACRYQAFDQLLNCGDMGRAWAHLLRWQGGCSGKLPFGGEGALLLAYLWDRGEVYGKSLEVSEWALGFSLPRRYRFEFEAFAGRALLETGRMEEGTGLLEQLVETTMVAAEKEPVMGIGSSWGAKSALSRASSTLARHYQKNRRWKAALKYWQIVGGHSCGGGCGTCQRGRNAWVRFRMSECREGLGRKDEAAKEYERLLLEAPGPVGLEAAIRLRELLGNDVLKAFAGKIVELKKEIRNHGGTPEEALRDWYPGAAWFEALRKNPTISSSEFRKNREEK